MSRLSDAWDEIVEDATPVEECYVTLYERVQCYGGPEEGGWYFDAIAPVESRYCMSRAEAKAIKAKVDAYAAEMTDERRKHHGDVCAAQLEALEARGLYDEPDYGGHGPDTPGIESYFVEVETVSGQRRTTTRPHYE